MAKFSRVSKLAKKEQQELLVEFCEALASLKNAQEAAKFLTDLLSPQEVEMLAKRLKIAELLLKGWEYQLIREELKVGFSTIARVNIWLQMAGEGFKMVLARKKKKPQGPTEEDIYNQFSWYNFKRRYSQYFWPSLLLDELIKQSDKANREKIISTLEDMGSKEWFFDRQANKELFNSFMKGVREKTEGKKTGGKKAELTKNNR